MSRVHHAWNFISGDCDEWVGFVILQQRVVAWFVLSDELALKDERLAGRSGDDTIDVVRLCDQHGDHIAIGILGEVGTNPVLKMSRFADIQNSIICGLEQIHTGLSRQMQR